MTSRTVSIAGRRIGVGEPPYVIAEMSGNHGGDIKRALAIIDAAKTAGADAVKMQTYTADTITIDHDGPGFRIESGLWKGRKLYELYQEAHTPWEWHEALFARGRELGITMFSSPFDSTAVDFLTDLGAPAYKIASFEVIDLPLIEKAAATGKPLIISSGMATLEEIGEAVTAARGAGAEDIILLHCVSGYPTPPEEANIRTVFDLAEQFGVVTGLSDHTLGTAVSVAAVAQGASLIEKHFTLRRADGGPDSTFSLEPEELKTLCQDCHTAWLAVGRVSYERKPSEADNVALRRSLYVVEDIKVGEAFTTRNLRSIRPGFGMPPKHLPEILGRRARKAMQYGTPLSMEMIAPEEKN